MYDIVINLFLKFKLYYHDSLVLFYLYFSVIFNLLKICCFNLLII